ncbi:MAG: Gfo/Idh/MocA family oxidoreductase [Acidobacteriota bacterium]|nr:MAG: Gfo/Idh/MocA family oxidoreductase [Acidobacteriota bacterium]
MQPLAVGVVGVGSLGQHHARIYSELEHANLVGVADQNGERASEIGLRLGCPATADYRDLFDKVQAISLAVPTEAHAAIGVEFLRRGIHVLVEKPIASTLAEADQLIDAAAQGNAVLNVGHTERFNPVTAAVRPYITTPQFFEAHRLGVFVRRSLDIDVVLDLMIHDLDLVLSMVADELVDVRAVGIPVLTPKVDIANARLEFANGCVANITASRVSRDKVRKLRLFQPSDYISIDFNNRSIEMYSLSTETGLPQILARQPEVQEGEPLALELASFLAGINGQSGLPNCDGQQGRKCLEVALQILQPMSPR